MNKEKTTQKVRWLKSGDIFVLNRTGEMYEYMCREIKTPSGIRHWVRRLSGKNHTTLHHSCHVQVVIAKGQA